VSAVTVENTHNLAGGRVTDPDRLAGIVAAAREAGLALHLDGARLWNAAAALGMPPARLVRGFDTVMVSFSKGLGCPVGSCLGFARERRARAWEIRKRLGGGMRQSGVLAAAGLYALEHHLPDIPRDHEHARLLAERLGSCAALRVETPESNIVMIDFVRERDDIQAVNRRLEAEGVLVSQYGPRRLRAVTHRDVSRAQVERAAEAFRTVLA
jgi:threonine aldolase